MSASEWPWPARSSANRRSCCVTSRPVTSIGESAETVTSLLFTLHQAQQTILLVVTHNATLAERCGIRYRLNGQRLETG